MNYQWLLLPECVMDAGYQACAKLLSRPTVAAFRIVLFITTYFHRCFLTVLMTLVSIYKVENDRNKEKALYVGVCSNVINNNNNNPVFLFKIRS